MTTFTRRNPGVVATSPRLARVFTICAEESLTLNARSIGTALLLYALVKEGGSASARILAKRNVTAERVYAALAEPGDEEPVDDEEITYSGPACDILGRAVTAAHLFGHGQFSPEHLFLTILDTEGCQAYTLLVELGVDMEELAVYMGNFLVQMQQQTRGGTP